MGREGGVRCPGDPGGDVVAKLAWIGESHFETMSWTQRYDMLVVLKCVIIWARSSKCCRALQYIYIFFYFPHITLLVARLVKHTN